MRSSRRAAALLLGAGVFVAGPMPAANAYGWGWGDHGGAVYDGPYAEGSYYTGSYKDSFARLAYPSERRCLMQWRTRPAPWGSSRYRVRVCR
jgi:hypothetical protein